MNPYDTWIEVSEPGLAQNLLAVRGLLSPGTRLMAVVKANCYGHGPEAAVILARAGIDMMGVTHLREAQQIRQQGVKADILVFSPLLAEQAPEAMEAGFTLTAASREDLQILSALGHKAGRRIPVHLKVDTGMGRLGVLPGETPAFAQFADGLPGIDVRGIYTHFPAATDENLTDTRLQLDEFTGLLSRLDRLGCRPPIAHCANSAATLRIPEAHLDMVRVGTLLYGQFPAPFLAGKLQLAATWRLMTRIVHVKDVPAGWAVGYGSEQRLSRATRIGVIPVGYADGFGVEVAARSRSTFSDRARSILKALNGPTGRHVLLETRQAPVLGRISMQLTTIDLTEFPDAEIGTLVEVPCRRVTSSPLLPRVVVREPRAASRKGTAPHA